MKLAELKLNEFAAAVAASSPAPGGGSVAAYAGAQGFALVAMVCRLTAGRAKFSAVAAQMKQLMAAAEEKQTYLLTLVDEDTEGFKAVMDALALPKNTEAEKLTRREAMERATLRAAEIPLQTARLCLEGLQAIPPLLESGNPNALSDMGVAAQMFKAGLEGALYNVQINAIGLSGESQKNSLLALAGSLREAGQVLAENIHAQVQARLR